MPNLFTLVVNNALVLAISISLAPISTQAASPNRLKPIEHLGKAIFFDSNLSEPTGQSCASCHSPETGFTGPSSAISNPGAVEPGAVKGRFGNRKPPTVAYASFSPAFHFDATEKLYIGGQFWDGRSKTLEEQAVQPFMNPVEMNNTTPESVCNKVAQTRYAPAFAEIFGALLDCSGDAASGMGWIAKALAAYQRSPEVTPFSSKYDYYLQGKAQLSALERKGLALFNAEKKGNCAACHPSKAQEKGVPPLFTDFTYDNLGLPGNPANPFPAQPIQYNSDGPAWIDRGLGAVIGNTDLNGAFKVPTLRNVARRPDTGFVRAYGHNGVLKSLKEVVHFYNTRDVKAAKWSAPEYPATMNTEELGDLKLTDAEENAIVAFLLTLTDGFDPKVGRYPD